MLPLQWSELGARLRRLALTVGQQAPAVDEVISPVMLAGRADYAPFRADPRGWAVLASQTGGAGAANRAVCQLELNLTQQRGGIALVYEIDVWTREAIQAAAVSEALLMIGPATGSGNGAQLTEPITFDNGIQQTLPVRAFGYNSALTPANFTSIARLPIIAATSLLWGRWTFPPDNPLVLASPETISGTASNAAIAVSIDALNSGAVNSIAVGASFRGVYFNRRPPV